MQITKSFVEVNKTMQPEYLYFNYQINYHHLHNTVLESANSDTTFKVNCQGVMYYYDYNQLFSLPYFKYDPEAEDYRKITSLTYNDWFWNSNNLLEYSNERKKKIAYFKKNGLLVNYRNTSLSPQKFKPGFFETSYIQWTDKKRLSLKKDGIKNDTLAASYQNQQFLSQRYKLSAQIFLDINPSGDSLQHYSTTLLDVYDTFYNLQEEPATNCFMNIYFDLVEMERRKMEEVIAKNKLKLPEMDALYKSTLKTVEQMSSDYFSKVSRGKNLYELEKWNFVVKQNLGINNFEIFGLSIKNK
ncbi:MAG: hypothetical protein IT236_17415 [Bacteroidia bacterium]|nr:hypothetical protein [Bacteroidia bacterium]